MIVCFGRYEDVQARGVPALGTPMPETMFCSAVAW